MGLVMARCPENHIRKDLTKNDLHGRAPARLEDNANSKFFGKLIEDRRAGIRVMPKARFLMNVIQNRIIET